MKINLNQRCTVVLRKRGVEALIRYHAELQTGPSTYNVGDVYSAQLWDIMYIFGAYCFMGPDAPFDTEIEIHEI